MALSYAGIPLPVLTRKTAERLERKISVDDLFPWDFNLSGDGRMGYTQAAEHHRRRSPRLGHLFWPTGASRWATGFFIASSADIQAIRQVVYQGSYKPANLILSDDERQITAKMWMLPAHPLEVDASRSGLWLLVLVDQRYFWWLNRTGNLSVAGGTAWASLYQIYANLLPSQPIIQVDPIPSAYQTAPGTFSATDEQIPPLLDSVARSVGQRIVCGLDGSVYAYNYSTSNRLRQANLANDYPVLAGSEMQLGARQDTPGYFPKTVRVDFPQTQVGNLLSSVAEVSVDFSALGILPGSQTNADTAVLYHPFEATLDASSVWTNQAACTALAKQYATDFYYYQTSPEDIVLAGIADWQPDGLEDWIEWTYIRGMVSTRVQRAPQVKEDIPSLASGTLGGPGSGGSGGSTITYNNYTFNYNTDVWNITNNTFNYDSTTVINYNSTQVNITNNTTWNLYSSTTWIIQGGNINTSIYEFNNLTVDFNSVNVEWTANQTWTLGVGVTLTWTGGAGSVWAINIPTVNIGNNAVWTWDSTTTAIFAGILEICGPWWLCYYTYTTDTGTLPNPMKPVGKVPGNNGTMPGIARPNPAQPQRTTLINNGTLPFFISDSAAGSDSIKTPTGGTMPVPVGAAVQLDYDTGASEWRVTGGSVLPTLTASDDSTPGYLIDKIVAGTNVTITEIGTTNKQLQIASTGGGGGTTGTNGETVLPSSYTVTATFGATGLSVNLPSAGTYLVQAEVSGSITNNGTPAGGYVQARLWNVTAGAMVADTLRVVCECPAVGTTGTGSTVCGRIITVSGATTIRLEAQYISTGTVLGASILLSTSSFGTTLMRYIKLA